MSNKPIIIIGIGVATAAIGYSIYKGVSLKETAENVSIKLLDFPKIHTGGLAKTVVSVDFRLDNPVKSKVNVKIPSIKAYYNGKQIASTAINDKTYVIEPVSSGKITGTKIELSNLNLLLSAPTLINDFVKQGAAGLANRFGFDVMLTVDGIPLKIQKL